MDSKKLGMFAAAALTLLAAQANAEGKKAAAAKAEEMTCGNTCGSVSGSGCGGKVEVEAGKKDAAACKAASGQWMSKAKLAEAQKKAETGTKADSHNHNHKH